MLNHESGIIATSILIAVGVELLTIVDESLVIIIVFHVYNIPCVQTISNNAEQRGTFFVLKTRFSE